MSDVLARIVAPFDRRAAVWAPVIGPREWNSSSSCPSGVAPISDANPGGRLPVVLRTCDIRCIRCWTMSGTFEGALVNPCCALAVPADGPKDPGSTKKLTVRANTNSEDLGIERIPHLSSYNLDA
jgi:hypothetical protein